MSAISFRPLVEPDLPLLHDWFQREHVRRWWRDEPSTLAETRAQYLPTLDGREPTYLCVILHDERPIGMIQTYLVSDYPEFARLVGLDAGVAGIDLLIGEEASTGRGLGTEAISSFVRDIVFVRPETAACVANPDSLNAVSLRAFAKAGFRDMGEVVEEGRPCRLLRLDRAS